MKLGEALAWGVGLGVLLATIALACTHREIKQPEEILMATLRVFVDPQYGCHYLSGSSSAALTPRLDAGGAHVGCGEVKDPR